MIFDSKPLRQITEADIRAEIAAGLPEHLYLEYKQQNYGQRDADRKEFLLDICQFANAQGGFILVGVPELREDGHPSG
ncbi:MAG: RNA-binding domain-containing protein, partial [Candidatus Acidiferrales bacterium]